MVGALVILNLVLTFAAPGISVGGHVGGLLAGSAAALLVSTGPRGTRRGARSPRTRDAAATLALAAALLVATVSVARALVVALAS